MNIRSIKISVALFFTAAAILTPAITTKTAAQTDQELFLFSQNNLTGNARFTAMGGAFGALGANFGVASTNPAGLGFYTRNEVSMSLAVGAWNSETRYNNKDKSAFRISLQMPNLHYVYSNSKANFQFGIGINRLNDFNARTSIEGKSDRSFTEKIAENANGIPAVFLGGLEQLAYDGFLLDVVDTINYTYASNLDNMQKGVTQKQVTETSGNLNELTFAFSGNVEEKFYFGVTLGIPMLDYRERSTFKEILEETSDYTYDLGFTDFTYAHDYSVDGTGVNLKLGMIYKPINTVRIGLAFHTPTYYSIRYRFKRELWVNMSNVTENAFGWNGSGKFYNWQEPNFNYGFFTPMKGLLSLGFIVGTYGVVGIEGELIGYRGIRMIVNNDIADQINEDIMKNYEKVSGVIKVGTEWRVSVVSLRAGYNYRSNPYIDKENNLWSNHTVTGGIGVRFNKSLSLDLGVIYAFNPETYHPYYLDNVKTSIIPDKIKTNRMLYTVSFNARF